jgi:hypothetical protein
MARRGVNAAVALCSLASIAASTLGVVAADGYWPGGNQTSSPPPTAAPVTNAAQLAPLPPMQLAPLDAPVIPTPVARVQSAPAGLVQAPTPAPAPPRPARRTRAS